MYWKLLPLSHLLIMLEVTVDLELGREEGRGVVTRGSLALREGLAGGTLAGPGHGSRHYKSSGHLEPVGAAGRGRRSQGRLCGVWGMEEWNPGAWWGQQLGGQRRPPGREGSKEERMGLQRLLGLQSLATSSTSPSSCLGPEAVLPLAPT